jgi:hypothetical protein
MKHFETDVYKMVVYSDGFVEFIVKNGVTLDVKDLLQSRKQSLEYLTGKKFFVLVEAEEFFQITIEARNMGASEDYSKDMGAVALYSKDLSLKILGNLYIKINKPQAPTRFFDEREKASAWLRSLMSKET